MKLTNLSSMRATDLYVLRSQVKGSQKRAVIREIEQREKRAMRKFISAGRGVA